MSKKLKLILTLFSLVLLSASIFAQTKKPKAIVPLDFGTIENQVYSNKYFNFQFNIPKTWQVQEEIIGKIIKDQAMKNAKGKTAATQNAMNQQMKKVNIIFTAFRDPAGTPDNASIMLLFEDMRSTPVVQNSRDYLQLAINTYRNMKMPDDFKYSSNIMTETIANTSFNYMETTKGIIKQRHYTLFRKGFGIIFVLTYINDNDLPTMQEMLKNGNYKFLGK